MKTFFRLTSLTFFLSFKTFSLIFKKRSWRISEINAAIFEAGLEALPVLILTTAFAGILITYQIAWHMDLALQDHTMIPTFTSQFIFKEMGVILPTFFLISKLGASLAAQMATLQVSEQIEALYLMSIDPVEYLLFPRWIGAMVVGFINTGVSLAVCLLGSCWIAVTEYHFSIYDILNSIHQISSQEFSSTLFKGTVFSGIIPLIACSYGFSAKKGASSVGKAATNAVVTCSLVIIVLDFLLTLCFSG